MNKVLILALAAAGAPLLAVNAQTIALATSSSNTTFTGAPNGELAIEFTTPLDASRNTLNEFQIGDSLSLSFGLSYANMTSSNSTNSNFSLGFLGVTSAFPVTTGSTGNSVIYSLLTPNADSLLGTANSSFRSRTGSIFMSNTGTLVTPGGATNYSTAPLYNTSPGSITGSFSIVKAGATTFDLALSLANSLNPSQPVTVLQTVTITNSTVLDSSLNALAFRNSNGLLGSSPTLTSYSASFTAVPEPSTIGLALAVGGFCLVRVLRRRSNS